MTTPPEKPFPVVPSADPGRSDLELARHLLDCAAQMRHLCSGVPVRDVNAAAMAQVMTEFDATMAELIRRLAAIGVEADPSELVTSGQAAATLVEPGQRVLACGGPGLVEALQYTVYGPEQHFDWHIDLGSGQTSARKLSMTLQLSEAGDYSGGALEFINAPSPAAARKIGAATVFPSYLAHRVAPVQSGVRRSLVAWAYGPAFK